MERCTRRKGRLERHAHDPHPGVTGQLEYDHPVSYEVAVAKKPRMILNSEVMGGGDRPARRGKYKHQQIIYCPFTNDRARAKHGYALSRASRTGSSSWRAQCSGVYFLNRVRLVPRGGPRALRPSRCTRSIFSAPTREAFWSMNRSLRLFSRTALCTNAASSCNSGL